MKWTVSELDEACGAEPGCVIRAGDPIAVLWRSPQLGSTRRIVRCVAHYAAERPGAEVDWNEIELERWRLEQERYRRVEAQAAPSDPPAPRRVPRPRKLEPLSAIGAGLFDPKSAAANDGRDD